MFGDVEDTIAAIASPPGGALRGIIRVSGPGTLAAIDRVCVANDGEPFATIPRASAKAGTIRLGADWGVAPTRTFVWPDRRSYTGQPSAELHLDGFPALLDQAIAALREAGVRLAQPGEFTFRAFLAGRIDLVQAEATLGLIDSRGKAEFDAALSQLAGGIALPIREMRESLLELLAHLEAGLDFVDEDIEFIDRQSLIAGLRNARERLEALASQIRLRSAAGRTPRIVLVGAPNVGKSSLLNALAGQDAAIVSSQAGTTRDWVIASGAAEGMTVDFVDTAGQCETPLDAIDRQSQAASRELASRADVRLLCFDSSRSLTLAESAAWAERQEDDLVVWTKRDAAKSEPLPFAGFETSTREGTGVEALRRSAVALALGPAASDVGMVAATALRGAESLGRAIDALGRAEALATLGHDETLIASELRGALWELRSIAGVVYTDDLLDRIFSRFCIGK